MNSLIQQYRASDYGRDDQRSDDEIFSEIGPRLSDPSLAARFPDAAEQWKQRQTPAPSPSVPSINWAERDRRLRQPGTLGGIYNSARNAFDSSRQAFMAGNGLDDNDAQAIADIEKRKQSRPAAEGYQAFQQASGWDAVKAFASNPIEVTANIIAEGLAGSAATLASGLAMAKTGAAIGSAIEPGGGSAIGALTGEIVGTAAGSFYTEYGSKILEELTKAGMDPSDPASITRFFSDENLMSKVRHKAVLRGVPVAAFDALSAGLGGRIIREGATIVGKKPLSKTGAHVGEMLVQGALGGAGEAAGSLTAGDPVSGKDVFAEVVGEVGPGAIEIAAGRHFSGHGEEQSANHETVNPGTKVVSPSSESSTPQTNVHKRVPTVAERIYLMPEDQARSRKTELSALTQLSPDEKAELTLLNARFPESQPAKSSNEKSRSDSSNASLIASDGTVLSDNAVVYEKVGTDSSGSNYYKVSYIDPSTGSVNVSSVPESMIRWNESQAQQVPPAPVPLVKPTTQGELRQRIAAANKTVSRIIKSVPGIDLSEVQGVQKEIISGNVAPETVLRFEQEVGKLDQRATIEAQQRELNKQKVRLEAQTERARIAAEKKAAAEKARLEKQAKANDKLARKILSELRKQQQEDFKTNPEAVISELQIEREAEAGAGGNTKSLDELIDGYIKQYRDQRDAADLSTAPADAPTGFPVSNRETPPPPSIVIEDEDGTESTYLKPIKVTAKNEKALLRNYRESQGSDKSAPNHTRVSLILKTPDGKIIERGIFNSGSRTMKGLAVQAVSRFSRKTGKSIDLSGSLPMLLKDLSKAGWKVLGRIQYADNQGKHLAREFGSLSDVESHIASSEKKSLRAVANERRQVRNARKIVSAIDEGIADFDPMKETPQSIIRKNGKLRNENQLDEQLGILGRWEDTHVSANIDSGRALSHIIRSGSEEVNGYSEQAQHVASLYNAILSRKDAIASEGQNEGGRIGEDGRPVDVVSMDAISGNRGMEDTSLTPSDEDAVAQAGGGDGEQASSAFYNPEFEASTIERLDNYGVDAKTANRIASADDIQAAILNDKELLSLLKRSGPESAKSVLDLLNELKASRDDGTTSRELGEEGLPGTQDQAGSDAATSSQSEADEDVLKLWNYINTKFGGDVYEAFNAFENKKAFRKFFDKLVDRGFTLSNISSAYDVVENYDQFEETLLGKPRLEADAPPMPGNVYSNGDGLMKARTAIDRLGAMGVDVRVLGKELGKGKGGASFNPRVAAVTLRDVANGDLVGLVRVIHEAAHSILSSYNQKTRDEVIAAAGRAQSKLLIRALKASAETGVSLARNIHRNTEETLVETTAHEIAAARIVDDPVAVSTALWRWVKSAYLRAASSVLRSFGVTEAADRMSLQWYDNQIRRAIGGDYELALTRMLDPYAIDPTAREETLFSESFEDADIERTEARDLETAAANNAIYSALDEIKKAYPDKDVWALLGINKKLNPSELRTSLETKHPGSSSQTFETLPTKAMQQRSRFLALSATKHVLKKAYAVIAKRDSLAEVASENLVSALDRVQKSEREYMDASFMHSNMLGSLKEMVRDVIRNVNSGMKLGFQAGELARAIRDSENLTAGEAIPENYQKVFKSVLDGGVPIFDYLSAMSKLGIDFGQLTISEAKAQIRAAAQSDPRLSNLVSNPALFTTLTSLAQQSSKQMALLQLRQMSDKTESAAIKTELEQIRVASKEQIEDLYKKSKEASDQSSLVARLRREYIRDRRSANTLEKAIRQNIDTRSQLLATVDKFEELRTSLDKQVGNFANFIYQRDAGYKAMVRTKDGWIATDQTLRFDNTDRLMNPDSVMEQLASNREYLRENSDLQGTELYEQVKTQTRIIGEQDFNHRISVSSRVWLIDALMPGLGKKLESIGVRGGRQVQQMMNRFAKIMKENQDVLGPLSHAWSKKLDVLFKETPKGLFNDWNDFHKTVLGPVFYAIESESGKGEQAALKLADSVARSRIGGEPGSKFTERLHDFIKATKAMSETMVGISEKNGLFVKDDRIGDQLRNYISSGWMMVPRSLDRGSIKAAIHEMAKSGWSLDTTEKEKVVDGQKVNVKSILKGSTFDGIAERMSDDELNAYLSSKFTGFVVDRWLLPFINKAGLPVFKTIRGRIDQNIAMSAWERSGGNVLGFIDALGEMSGGIDQIAEANKFSGDPRAQWRQSVLDTFDDLYSMEAKMLEQHEVSLTPNAPVSHVMMDARTSEMIPPEHLSYAFFDPTQSMSHLGAMAYHSAFGRDGMAVAHAFSEAQKELDARVSMWAEIRDSHTSKSSRKKAAEQLGYDWETLARASKDRRRLESWRDTFKGMFSPNNRNGVVSDVSSIHEFLKFNQVMMLNQPTSALWNILSAADFPIVYKSVGKGSGRALALQAFNMAKQVIGSALSSGLGLNLLRASEYESDVIGMQSRRNTNSLEWGMRLHDVGNHGEYMGNDSMVDRAGAAIKKGTRAATNIIDKGITPADLLRRDQSSKTGFARFTFLTSPFKYINDLVATSTAMTNIQMYEWMLTKGIRFFADNPDIAANHSYQITDSDLGMGDLMGVFGDKGVFSFYKSKVKEYGLGSFEDMVRQAAERKSTGQPLLSRDQAIQLGIMAMNEVSLESSVTTRPAEMFTNPMVRMATPLLGWPIAKGAQISELFKGENGRIGAQSAAKALAVVGMVTLPAALAFSLGMDEWDEKVRGKRPQYAELKLDDGLSQQNVMSAMARLARAGSLGLPYDLVYGRFVAPLDPASGQRQFTLDSRILVYSQLNNFGEALKSIAMQGGVKNSTWASGYRQLAYSMGANGPIQYIQTLNKMGLNLSEDEKRVVARQNIYAAIRHAALVSGIAVRKFGGSSTPTPAMVWIREMQLAAFSNDRVKFRDAYIKALTEARKAGEDDPKAWVRSKWRQRDPFRVLDGKPTDSELRRIYSALDDNGRVLVREASLMFKRYSSMIDPDSSRSSY